MSKKREQSENDRLNIGQEEWSRGDGKRKEEI